MNDINKNIQKHMENGVIFPFPNMVTIEDNVVIGKGTIIDQGAKLLGLCEIEENVRIEGPSIIIDSHIKKNAVIINSMIEKSIIGECCQVGPYAHVRPDSKIDKNVKIGNFVEIKKSTIGEGCKISHLAYVGDANLGKNINVGCGVIFANYDGKNKYQTTVGNDVFIGSNTNLVAPLLIGDNVFIAAGTTVTKDIPPDKFCIGRVRQENKDKKQDKEKTKRYFGTDGIRGIYGKDLTINLAVECGNALSKLKSNAKIIIGRDTRASGKNLTESFCLGATTGGAKIIDIGIVPTPVVSYITIREKADYGVVISASHNPEAYNGIKIFGNDGRKISDKTELELEKNFGKTTYLSGGNYEEKELSESYYEHIKKKVPIKIENTKIKLDCANGSSYVAAPRIFSEYGIIPEKISCGDGEINKNCGSTYIDNLIGKMKDSELGFSYDGDGDRLICVDKKGKVLDGDIMLYMLSLYYKLKGKLTNNIVIGTLHTNMAIENALKNEGIRLIRANIGDRFVMEKMVEYGAMIGAEQSGHIILSDIIPTGDGILASLVVSDIYKNYNEIFTKASDLILYPQSNLNYAVKDKNKVIQNQSLSELKDRKENELSGKGRILVRASGTEPKVRIMVECEDKNICENIANEFFELMKVISE